MKLHYRKYGKGTDYLIILHGLLGSSQNWHRVARALSDQFNIIVPELRNHGESPHGKHSFDLMRGDLFELLNHQQIDKPILLGHSMGGLVAMLFAFSYPERLRALIVVDIAPETHLTGMNYIFRALQNVDLTIVNRREDAEQQLAASIENQTIRQFLLQNLKRQDDGSYTWRCNLPELHRFIQNPERFKIRETDRYPGPVLFVGGGRSDYQLVEKENLIRQHFQNYQLIMIPNAGHWVHFQAMPEFVEVLNTFMKNL
jgi:pimeloyl-ACP methyl ester carboxylesterase